MKASGSSKVRRFALLMAMASMANSGSGIHVARPKKRVEAKSYKKELPLNNQRRSKYKKKRNRVGK